MREIFSALFLECKIKCDTPRRRVAFSLFSSFSFRDLLKIDTHTQYKTSPPPPSLPLPPPSPPPFPPPSPPLPPHITHNTHNMLKYVDSKIEDRKRKSFNESLQFLIFCLFVCLFKQKQLLFKNFKLSCEKGILVRGAA